MRTGSRIVVAIVTMMASILLAAPQASAQQPTRPVTFRSPRRSALHPQRELPEQVRLGGHGPDRGGTGGAQRLQGTRRCRPGGDRELGRVCRCFDGQITYGRHRGLQSADIVVHYVPHAGGVVFAGYAICGANGCANIIVSSEFADRGGYTRPSTCTTSPCTSSATPSAWGTRQTCEESTDLMGYGWIGDAPDPLFSQCDLDALAYLFGPWSPAGTQPGPGPSTLEPTFDCSAA